MLDPERSEPSPAEPAEPAEPGESTEPSQSAEPTEPAPAAAATPDAPARSAWPAVAYWATRAAVAPSPVATPPPQPATPPPAPAPTWTKAYELPTARSVVSAGFQLALASSAAVRRASIYIGLLSLGAFGPVVILLLVGIGRLMSDPTTADTIASDPSLLFFEQPGIAQPLTLIYVLVIVGLVLIAAIGVDAQAIAVAMLAGVAAERPLRLAEAITRARQTFWRLVGAGIIVGLVSGVVSLVVAWPFLKPFDTNTGVSFIGSMIGILVVSPWAYAATCIVLGDVGVVESLRRSVTLFRARKRIALVVVLFTLVTAAIQTFAFGAGLDVAVRVGELFQFGLDQGPISLILPGILVLALVVAFGSLTFTIAAIVAAPQVAAFLGLTFHSGGLERARAKEGFRPGPLHWVSVPMAVAMALIVIVAAAGLPLITNFQPRAPSLILQALRSAAEANGTFVFADGEPGVVEDVRRDVAAESDADIDILIGDYGYLPDVPTWLLDGPFRCSSPGVNCPDFGSGAAAFQTEGALIFLQRMAAAPGPEIASQRTWGALLKISGVPSSIDTPPFGSASHAIVTVLEDGSFRVSKFLYRSGRFLETATNARSAWFGQDLITLIPWTELPGFPSGWDVYAADGSPAGGDERRDTITDNDLRQFDPASYAFLEAFDDFE